METRMGTQRLSWSAPHTWCGALALPPRTAVPTPAAGTRRSASGEGDSKDLGTGAAGEAEHRQRDAQAPKAVPTALLGSPEDDDDV